MPRPTKIQLSEKETLFRQGLRLCVKCGAVLPLSSFGTLSKDTHGLQKKCKSCINSLNRSYYAESAKDPDWMEKHRVEKLSNYHRTPRQVRADRQRRYSWKRLYGMTPEDFQKRLKDQNNVCALCQEPFTETPHVDHDHQTGAVRGLLHNSCNRALGLMKDSPEKLDLAARYLRSA